MFRFLALLTLCVGLVTPSVFAQVALTSTLMGVSDEGAIHRVSISLPDGARVQSVYADNGQPMSVTAEEGFAQSDGEVILANAASADSVDSWFTIGLPGAATELYSTGGTVWNTPWPVLPLTKSPPPAKLATASFHTVPPVE